VPARGTQVNNNILIEFVDAVEEAHKLNGGGS
jgi:hypothetical protein